VTLKPVNELSGRASKYGDGEDGIGGAGGEEVV
jgi:hypothetical protein